MYDVDKIEKEWYRYRRKKIFKAVGITTVVLSIISFVILSPNLGISFGDSNSTVIATNITKAKIIDEPKRVNRLETQVPSLEPKANIENRKVGQMVFQSSEDSIKKEPRKRKKLHIEVTSRDGKSIAKDIESRFKFAKDKDDALFLAKYYYDKNMYSKSEIWALEANKIDNNMDNSWIIFAKSLAKQGKRAESLKVLQSYYDKSSSINAKKLMDKIRRGKSF